MKRLLLLCLLPFASLPAATIWTGPSIVFEKADGVLPTTPPGQDLLSPSVRLTRGINQGLYNTAREDSYTPAAPTGTEWAFGTTAEVASLSFTSWFAWVAANPPGVIGRNAVVHLVEEDIYLDIVFLSWTTGFTANYPGFSYQRTTPVPEPSLSLFLIPTCLALFQRRRTRNDS